MGDENKFSTFISSVGRENYFPMFVTEDGPRPFHFVAHSLFQGHEIYARRPYT